MRTMSGDICDHCHRANPALSDNASTPARKFCDYACALAYASQTGVDRSTAIRLAVFAERHRIDAFIGAWAMRFSGGSIRAEMLRLASLVRSGRTI